MLPSRKRRHGRSYRLTVFDHTPTDLSYERRASPRVAFAQPIHLRRGRLRRWRRGEIVDLSESGARVRECRDLSVGERLICSLRLARHEVLSLSCRVIWADSRGNAGLEFVGVDALLGRRLRQAVHRIAARRAWDGVAIDPVHAEDGTWAPPETLDGDEPS